MLKISLQDLLHIKKIVYLDKKDIKDSHKINNSCVENMLKEVGIEIVSFSDLKIKDTEFTSKLLQLNEKFYSK